MARPSQNDSLSNRVIGDQVRLLAINQLDERLERYRLAQPKLEQQMLKSFRDYGQLSPVVVCQLDGQTVLGHGLAKSDGHKPKAKSNDRSLQHLNESTRWWLAEVADKRIHGTTKKTPLELHAQELPHLLALPSLQFDTAHWNASWPNKVRPSHRGNS